MKRLLEHFIIVDFGKINKVEGKEEKKSRPLLNGIYGRFRVTYAFFFFLRSTQHVQAQAAKTTTMIMMSGSFEPPAEPAPS